MRYCDDCAKEREWPISSAKRTRDDIDTCRICGTIAALNNTPTDDLPLPKPMVKGKWYLEGFDGETYGIPGEWDTQEQAETAALEQLQKVKVAALEQRQKIKGWVLSSFLSPKQLGVEDEIYVIRHDDIKYRFTEKTQGKHRKNR